jgi:hypothetical protein
MYPFRFVGKGLQHAGGISQPFANFSALYGEVGTPDSVAGKHKSGHSSPAQKQLAPPIQDCYLLLALWTVKPAPKSAVVTGCPGEGDGLLGRFPPCTFVAAVTVSEQESVFSHPKTDGTEVIAVLRPDSDPGSLDRVLPGDADTVYR